MVELHDDDAISVTALAEVFTLLGVPHFFWKRFFTWLANRCRRYQGERLFLGFGCEHFHCLEADAGGCEGGRGVHGDAGDLLRLQLAASFSFMSFGGRPQYALSQVSGSCLL